MQPNTHFLLSFFLKSPGTAAAAAAAGGGGAASPPFFMSAPPAAAAPKKASAAKKSGGSKVVLGSNAINSAMSSCARILGRCYHVVVLAIIMLTYSLYLRMISANSSSITLLYSFLPFAS
jgi:hypothetical protein